ncbi:hypothetical protein O181_051888 [Austropuccinia psidii MF-1]|uniref:Integrase catalytic domain-containing protein n=1 Tax=Austropuccinia psidii MF-1 TaxID=1389203 RepID=A0A9Q3E4H2_9BASI|nr:hypothetical protein [Austropuccinia psidii MF-1]
MLEPKLELFTAYHPQTDGLAERMIQNMEDIIRRFCAYGMEYKDHEGYTNEWFTLLTAIQLSHSTIQNYITGNTPSLTEKG